MHSVFEENLLLVQSSSPAEISPEDCCFILGLPLQGVLLDGDMQLFGITLIFAFRLF